VTPPDQLLGELAADEAGRTCDEVSRQRLNA
jgi:hypothetical protein